MTTRTPDTAPGKRHRACLRHDKRHRKRRHAGLADSAYPSLPTLPTARSELASTVLMSTHRAIIDDLPSGAHDYQRERDRARRQPSQRPDRDDGEDQSPSAKRPETGQQDETRDRVTHYGRSDRLHEVHRSPPIPFGVGHAYVALPHQKDRLPARHPNPSTDCLVDWKCSLDASPCRVEQSSGVTAAVSVLS